MASRNPRQQAAHHGPLFGHVLGGSGSRCVAGHQVGKLAPPKIAVVVLLAEDLDDALEQGTRSVPGSRVSNARLRL